MNSVCISGNMTADPQIAESNEGTKYCHFTVAVRRPRTKEKTDFIRCVAFDSTAEFIGKWFAKGKRIEVCGVITSSNYETPDGEKRTYTEVIADNVGFGGQLDKTEAESAPTRFIDVSEIPGSTPARQKKAAAKAQKEELPFDTQELTDDDIPF